MSGAVGLLGSVALGTALTAAISGPQVLTSIGDVFIEPFRAIGLIIPDLVIEEVSRDELDITEHPVENGAPITDHSYKRPMEVSIRAGWSNSGQYAGYVQDVYNALLGLQASRQPFNVFTGKRFYTNMLIASLIQTTNETSGDFSLMVQALLKEIIIVNTQATQTPAASQSQPSSTLGLSANGQAQVSTAPPATQNVLNTQSAPFNGASALPVNPATGEGIPTFAIGGA